MNESTGTQPTDPKRVRAFARFFKSYMSISTLVVAALPIPVTAFKLIPTYSAQRGYLSVYTSLFCFLLLGFIFYSRVPLARLMFAGGSYTSSRIWRSVNMSIRGLVACLPFLLICFSLFSLVQYHLILEGSIARLRWETATFADGPVALRKDMETLWDLQKKLKSQSSANPTQRQSLTTLTESVYKAAATVMGAYVDLGESRQSTKEILETTDADQIPASVFWRFLPAWSRGGAILAILYLLIFLSAEAAFVLMALKEYLQDLQGLEDIDLIRGARTSMSEKG